MHHFDCFHGVGWAFALIGDEFSVHALVGQTLAEKNEKPWLAKHNATAVK
jgi:hypothetical protein